MAGKSKKADKVKKKPKTKNLKPGMEKASEKANSYNEIKKALKKINLKRIIIDAEDK